LGKAFFDMNRLLLILDLDETLIFATETALERARDFRVGPYHVYRRPRLDEFLQVCATHFDLAVWTSASADYAKEVIAHIFPADLRLVFIWSRDRCVPRVNPDQPGADWLKDLKKVKRRGHPLERVLMVDDRSENLTRNYGNHLPVTAYEGDPTDNELQLLARYLPQLAAVSDVRRIEKRHWREQVRNQKKT
jgi:RNA polymerase II subunit A small phosphatase-like protein